MTPRQLLERTPESYLHYEDEVPIQIAYFKEHHHDHRRVWVLACGYVRDKPVVILQCAGREGDDHVCHFVLDRRGYARFMAELELCDYHFFPYGRYSYKPVEERVFDVELDTDLGPQELTSWNSQEGPKLTTFYGHTLDGRFDRY